MARRAERVRRPPRALTGRGVAALLSGGGLLVAANVTAVPALLALGVLLIALVVIAAIVVHAPRSGAGVGRAVAADLLSVGAESAVALRLDLRTVLPPSPGVWSDALPAAVDGDAGGPFPPEDRRRGPDGTTMTLRYRIRGRRRGLWALGPVSVTTGDPFGLVRRTREFGEVTPITVVPEVVVLPALPDRAGRAGGTAQTSASRLGQGADNMSPRRYVPGDSMRRIHWRATAHRGDLMVRQEEQESSPDALVVLDRAGARWPGRGRRGDSADPAFERAVSACASIALHLAEHGYAVDVVDATGVLLGRLRGAEDEREALLVVLAAVSPRSGEHDEGLPAAANGHLVGPLVMITGAIDPAEAATLPHGGAATPILLATESPPAALSAAASRGWRAGALDDDIAGSWGDAGGAADAGR